MSKMTYKKEMGIMIRAKDKNVRTKFDINERNLNLKIYFYQSNFMPVLLLEDEDSIIYSDLTTNYSDDIHFDRCISIRSDDPISYKILLEGGWIKPERVCSVPQGFIEIVLYQLTDKAYLKVIQAAIEQGEQYPNN